MPRRILRECKSLILWALSACLEGCIGSASIHPQSALPNANALARGEALEHARIDAGWTPQQWWQAFADPQLERWMNLALQGNPSLAMASARLREAQAQAGIQAARQAPQVNAQGHLDRREWPQDGFYGPGSLGGSRTWDNQADLLLSYDLDLWGRRQAAQQQALDLAHQQLAQTRQAELELSVNLVRVYVELALAYDLRDLTHATLERQQRLSGFARERLRHGLGTQLEVAQADAPLPDSERQLDALEERIALLGHQLAALSGQGPGAATDLQRPQLRLARDLALPSRLPAQLLGRRPDVVAARWQVAAQAQGIAVAQAGFYPDVNLLGSLGYRASSGDLLGFLATDQRNYSVGPALSLPIFDGGSLRSQLGVASARYDEAAEHYRATLLAALQEVADQLLRRESLTKQADFAAAGAANAQRAFELAMSAYRRGLSDYSNVLFSENLWLQQQRLERQLQARRLQTYAALAGALGGHLDAADDAPDKQRLQPPDAPRLHLGRAYNAALQP